MGTSKAESTAEISEPQAWATPTATRPGYFPVMAVIHPEPPECPHRAQGMVLISVCPDRRARVSSAMRKAFPDPLAMLDQLLQVVLPLPGAPVIREGAMKTEFHFFAKVSHCTSDIIWVASPSRVHPCWCTITLRRVVTP